MTSFQKISENRLLGLILKETLHTLRDKHLLFLLIFPPTVQLLILGAALDVGVKNVPIGVVDYCHSTVSREFVSAITSNRIFHLKKTYVAEGSMDHDLKISDIKVGLVIPADFEQNLDREHICHVPVKIDGVDAYTAAVARGYLLQMFEQFPAGAERREQLIAPIVTVIFNPGLVSSWYFIPGIIGAMLTLTSTLVSSASLLREKELGTLEQLLMTPYSVGEILFAKVFPVFVLLMGDVFLALIMALFVFHLPLRGELSLFLLASALYILVGMGLGIFMATVCKTERQAHLVSFFVNIPIMQLSGAIVPFETMPAILQQLATLNPLRYYTLIARSIFLKGTSAGALLPDFLALVTIGLALFAVSIACFRRQLD